MFLEEKKLGPLVETKPESEELKIVREARRLIAKGWAKGAYRTFGLRGFRYCAVGAMAKAAGLAAGDAYHHPNLALWKAEAALRDGGGIAVWQGIETWNDRRGRTKQEVLAALDRAIASLE